MDIPPPLDFTYPRKDEIIAYGLVHKGAQHLNHGVA